MKRIILNVILLSFGLVSVAQTNSITSGNMPVNEGKGYKFDFNGTSTDNCTDAKVPNSGIVYDGISVDSVAEGVLFVSTDGESVGWGNLALRLNQGNCEDYDFDMSSPNSQRIEIKIKTSAAMAEFKVLLMDADGKANDSLNYTAASLPAGADTVLVFDQIDFHQWASDDVIDNSSITNVLIYFRDDYATQVAGNFEIEYIALGEVTVVGVNSKIQKNKILVYPNPATTNVNFESTLENVTIYNVVGVPVYEAQSASSVDVSSFDSGVYFIQHAAGTTRFTVQ